MKDFEKVKDTLLKLKTLAERGQENEKLVAKQKLTQLLEKYKISIGNEYYVLTR